MKRILPTRLPIAGAEGAANALTVGLCTASDDLGADVSDVQAFVDESLDLVGVTDDLNGDDAVNMLGIQTVTAAVLGCGRPANTGTFVTTLDFNPKAGAMLPAAEVRREFVYVRYGALARQTVGESE